MLRKAALPVILLILLFISGWTEAKIRIIPEPSVVEWKKGIYSTKVAEGTGVWLDALNGTLFPDDFQRFPTVESYFLKVTPREIRLEARDAKGLFYGKQTLRQLLEMTAKGRLRIPAVEITDQPRFAYRGIMIDVSRHFYPKEFILKQLDAMSRYKLNTLHLHLTDAAGWRLEIDRYPLLTRVAAWRTHPEWKSWWNGDRKYLHYTDPGAKGGYYSKEDVREIIRYASERNISVVPEIEMPGHSEEVLAVHPELSCSGKPYQQGEFCPGKDTSIVFLQHVLSEVMELFPSTYIHIGGDEANKTPWKNCVHCQERMRELGLQNEKELQSWFVSQIGSFLKQNGRRLLGWDEITEGGIPEGATVMSWRGESGGNTALLTQRHAAIMSPGGFCYLDAYQDAPHTQPEAIGGYIPLAKLYSYEPFSEVESRVHRDSMLGVQANVWTEYISTEKHAETMLWPRAMALAEIGWSEKGKKDFGAFRKAALREVEKLKSAGYSPFELKNEVGNRPESLSKQIHKAVGKKVSYLSEFNQVYAAGGDSALTDGWRGGWTYGDGRWQGFIGPRRLELVIDLGEKQKFKSVALDCMQSEGAEVYLPVWLQIEISDDNQNYTVIHREENAVIKTGQVQFRRYSWKGRAVARYLKVSARSSRELGGWIFTDEVIVE